MRAYEIASQWGSYISAGDQGACFMSFFAGDGTPQTEGHREACLAYTIDLLAAVQSGDAGDNREADRADLISLLAFLNEAEPHSIVTPSNPELGEDLWAS